METEVARKLFTVDEYYRLAEVGILGPQERVELIDGEILRMSPIGHRHAARVTRALRLFGQAFLNRAVVSPQNPIQLNDYTEPEPDILVLKPRTDDYESEKVRAAAALLILEVSDTTFQYDCTIKLPRYAAAGIPEVWIENIETDELLIFRCPAEDKYTESVVLRRGDSIAPLAFPGNVFKVDDFLGPLASKG